MTDYTRWSEDRTGNGWSGTQEPYSRQSRDGVYGGGRDRQSGGPAYGYNPGDQYGGGDNPRHEERRFSGRSNGRYGASGPDAYGVPSDYSYQGLEIQDRNAQNRGYGAGSNQSYGDQYRAYGAEHYPLDSRRAPDDRSFWSQARDEVAAWFGDEHATRRRQTDDLYFGEHRGKGPKGYTRSDERIRDDVNDRLTDHGHLDASDIEIAVSGAEVTLNGTVLRREDKRRAEDIAEQVSGVKHVQNNLRVKDSGIAAKSGGYGAATVGSTGSQSSGVSQTKAN